MVLIPDPRAGIVCEKISIYSWSDMSEKREVGGGLNWLKSEQTIGYSKLFTNYCEIFTAAPLKDNVQCCVSILVSQFYHICVLLLFDTILYCFS